MQPVMRLHVSFIVVSISFLCVERAQTGQQYSATERHSVVAVVLIVWGNAPQFVPCIFLGRLFRRIVLHESPGSGFCRRVSGRV